MTRAVSVVVPCLDDRDLLERHLPPLLAELDRRGAGDEVVLVDDTGSAVLEDWAAEHFPACRVLSNVRNSGFAQTLLAGVEGAKHELVFSMNPDVLVHEGFLDPLVACMAEDDVFAVAPRVLLDGEDRVESITELAVRDGDVRILQPGLEPGASTSGPLPRPIVFAVGGTCLLRREAFLEVGGMDPLYEPFYLEDLALCFDAWSRGLRVLYQPASVVEHHHRGTIGKLVDADFVRAVIEKNRMLFQWSRLDEPELLQDHLGALYRRATDAFLSDSSEELVWILLALDQADDALAARRHAKRAHGFREVVERSRRSR